MKKLVLALLAAVSLNGCGTLTAEGHTVFGAALMGVSQNYQNRQNYLTIPTPQSPALSPALANQFQPRMVDPQRGTQYCNSQGLCFWK